MTVALFLQFLPYLFQAAAAVPEILAYIQKTRETLQQTGEWTPDAEAAFNKEIANLQTNPPDDWKPDSNK